MIIAGFLFAAGFTLPVVATTLAFGSMAAAMILILLKVNDTR